MAVDLVNNNTSGNLIVFVKKGGAKFYCLAEVEYWIAEWWDGYVDLDEGSLEDLYFDYLGRFKVDYPELKSAYEDLIDLGDDFKLDGNKPVLFVDFDAKEFNSIFYDQSLETRLPAGWAGTFGGVFESIPLEYNYWNIDDKKST